MRPVADGKVIRRKKTKQNSKSNGIPMRLSSRGQKNGNNNNINRKPYHFPNPFLNYSLEKLCQVKWAHLTCANWIPEVTIDNDGVDLTDLDPKRFNKVCHICETKNGAFLECGARADCLRRFHVMCAVQAKLNLDIVEKRVEINPPSGTKKRPKKKSRASKRKRRRSAVCKENREEEEEGGEERYTTVDVLIVKCRKHGDNRLSNARFAICPKCGKGDREAEMLICDGCEQGYHYSCIGMPKKTFQILTSSEVCNEENWFCSNCYESDPIVKEQVERSGNLSATTRHFILQSAQKKKREAEAMLNSVSSRTRRQRAGSFDRTEQQEQQLEMNNTLMMNSRNTNALLSTDIRPHQQRHQGLASTSNGIRSRITTNGYKKRRTLSSTVASTTTTTTRGMTTTTPSFGGTSLVSTNHVERRPPLYGEIMTNSRGKMMTHSGRPEEEEEEEENDELSNDEVSDDDDDLTRDLETMYPDLDFSHQRNVGIKKSKSNRKGKIKKGKAGSKSIAKKNQQNSRQRHARKNMKKSNPITTAESILSSAAAATTTDGHYNANDLNNPYAEFHHDYFRCFLQPSVSSYTKKKRRNDVGTSNSSSSASNNSSSTDPSSSSSTMVDTFVCPNLSTRNYILNTQIDCQNKHSMAIARLQRPYEKITKYAEWITLLHSGFNILLWGIGDKSFILEKCKKILNISRNHILQSQPFVMNNNIYDNSDKRIRGEKNVTSSSSDDFSSSDESSSNESSQDEDEGLEEEEDEPNSNSEPQNPGKYDGNNMRN
eukprot:g209.t1